MYTISPVYARLVLREVLDLGLPEGPLFAGTSLERHLLETGNNITLDDFARLLENARPIIGDEKLGFMIGRHTHIVALGPVGGAGAAAPTVRQGLQAMENFSRLHATYIRISLASNLGGMSVKFHYLTDLGDVERFHSEAAVMLVQSYVEMMTGHTLDDAQNRMGFAEPGSAQAYSRWLHSPVTFGRDYTSVELPHHWLDRPSPYFNAEIWNHAQLLLAQRMRELSSESGDTYTQHLTALMRSFEPPLPDLSVIIDRLHMSERTLNRRLRQEGTSFRQIKGEVLQGWAHQYLAGTEYTVEVIGALLGYQDTANFRRAFRSREGCSPSEFRKEVKGSVTTDNHFHLHTYT